MAENGKKKPENTTDTEELSLSHKLSPEPRCIRATHY